MREVYHSDFNWWQQAMAMLVGLKRVNQESLDFKWGYFAPRFGFELTISRGFYFSQQYRLNICLGWGHFHIHLPFKTRLPEHCDWPRYGIRISDNTLWIENGAYELNQETRKSITWDLPFFAWVFDFHQHKAPDGSWVKGGYQHEDNAHKETHDYTYNLKSGEIQKREATCHIERRRWHRKWLPFWTMTNVSLSVSFDGEVGERTGSWKGGTIGCGWDVREGENIYQALRRMEAEREFR